MKDSLTDRKVNKFLHKLYNNNFVIHEINFQGASIWISGHNTMAVTVSLHIRDGVLLKKLLTIIIIIIPPPPRQHILWKDKD